MKNYTKNIYSIIKISIRSINIIHPHLKQTTSNSKLKNLNSTTRDLTVTISDRKNKHKIN
ncbi:hypothetical protein HanIR_Chr11g0529801 [Helianthus annuus]|nr:hypothetical protein HanIR_Chr11g0529801 [Helianthus annuus]